MKLAHYLMIALLGFGLTACGGEGGGESGGGENGGEEKSQREKDIEATTYTEPQKLLDDMVEHKAHAVERYNAFYAKLPNKSTVDEGKALMDSIVDAGKQESLELAKWRTELPKAEGFMDETDNILFKEFTTLTARWKIIVKDVVEKGKAVEESAQHSVCEDNWKSAIEDWEAAKQAFSQANNL